MKKYISLIVIIIFLSFNQAYGEACTRTKLELYASQIKHIKEEAKNLEKDYNSGEINNEQFTEQKDNIIKLYDTLLIANKIENKKYNACILGDNKTMLTASLQELYFFGDYKKLSQVTEAYASTLEKGSPEYIAISKMYISANINLMEEYLKDGEYERILDNSNKMLEGLGKDFTISLFYKGIATLITKNKDEGIKIMKEAIEKEESSELKNLMKKYLEELIKISDGNYIWHFETNSEGIYNISKIEKVEIKEIENIDKIQTNAKKLLKK